MKRNIEKWYMLIRCIEIIDVHVYYFKLILKNLQIVQTTKF